MSLAGLVLAGGLGTRLGGVDKAFLRLGSETVLEHVLGRVRPQVDVLAVSANGDPARFEKFGVLVLPDAVAGRGPLEGVLRGLDWADSVGAESLLTVPADTPFVPRDLAARLGAAPACAATGGGTHYLAAVWPVSVRHDLAGWLERDRRVGGFAASIGVRSVWFGDTPDPFLNINTADDLNAAREIYRMGFSPSSLRTDDPI